VKIYVIHGLRPVDSAIILATFIAPSVRVGAHRSLQ
jgi:hypothetical protein